MLQVIDGNEKWMIGIDNLILGKALFCLICQLSNRSQHLHLHSFMT